MVTWQEPGWPVSTHFEDNGLQYGVLRLELLWLGCDHALSAGTSGSELDYSIIMSTKGVIPVIIYFLRNRVCHQTVPGLSSLFPLSRRFLVGLQANNLPCHLLTTESNTASDSAEPRAAAISRLRPGGSPLREDGLGNTSCAHLPSGPASNGDWRWMYGSGR